MPCGAGGRSCRHDCPQPSNTEHRHAEDCGNNLHVYGLDGGVKMSGDGWSAGGLRENASMKITKITRNIARVVAVGAIAGGGLALAGTGANAADGGTWDALAQCESSGDWGINNGNGFAGGLQFTPSTWAAFGGTGAASDASREQQIAVAENVQAGQGWGAWPSCAAQLGLSGGGGAAYTPAAVPEAPAPVVAQSSDVQPVQQVPVQQVPVQQVPVEQAPLQQLPVEQAPLQQLPVEQAPVQQAPAAIALSGETYTIESGDTLSIIAEKLNIAGGWETLYQANVDTVIHPDLIFTGAVLNLPA